MKLSTEILAVFMGIAGVQAGAVDVLFDIMAMRPRATTSTLASGVNLQTFTSALGSAAASPILTTGNAERPFSCDGATFTNFASAAQRSCDNQHNACTQIANGAASSNTEKITVAQCETQHTSCLAVQQTAASTPGVAAATSASKTTASVESTTPPEATAQSESTSSSSSTSSSTSTSSTSTSTIDDATTTQAAIASPAAEALQTVQSVNDDFFFICDL